MGHYINKVWRITDLVRLIGAWKSDFELIYDIEKLNSIQHFQDLIYILFNSLHDCGLVIRKNDKRLYVNLCFHMEGSIVINFEVFEKYKKRSCYESLLVIDDNKEPCDIQYIIADHIWKDDNILEFFR